MSSITEFLKNQTIFLTGVTGFLGKVMLWKALNEAGESIKIFVMVRPSKEGNAKKRLEEVFSTRIFDELLQSKPFVRERVIAIEGDITQEGFGLSEEDRKTIELETTMIIHSAATTKFTENLKLAVDINVLAVRRVITLAKNCPKLVSMVHISTCYVAADKPNEPIIHEQLYPLKVSPNEIIEKVANMTLKEADDKTNELIHPFPNTYSFTKALGEHLLFAERGDLPVCILRPSIVTAALQEPLPGWIDVLLGPAGLFVATGVGALRVMKGSNQNIADFVPVDIVCNAILAAGWRNVKLAQEFPEVFPKNIPIYQVASSVANPLKWLWPESIVAAYFSRHKPKRSFGYPYAFFCNSDIGFAMSNWILHFVPAFFVDGMRLLQGKKTFMVKAAKRLNRAVHSLTHFTVNNWYFSCQSMEKMLTDLSETDAKLYNINIKNLDWDSYFMTFCHGMRMYLLKDDEEPTKPSEKQQQQQQQEKRGFFQSIMHNMRSYLLIISLGCLIYFFRQNYWILRLRAKQIRQAVLNVAQKMTVQRLTA